MCTIAIVINFHSKYFTGPFLTDIGRTSYCHSKELREKRQQKEEKERGESSKEVRDILLTNLFYLLSEIVRKEKLLFLLRSWQFQVFKFKRNYIMCIIIVHRITLKLILRMWKSMFTRLYRSFSFSESLFIYVYTVFATFLKHYFVKRYYCYTFQLLASILPGNTK